MIWRDVGCGRVHERHIMTVLIYLSYDTAALLFWSVSHFLLSRFLEQHHTLSDGKHDIYGGP